MVIELEGKNLLWSKRVDSHGLTIRDILGAGLLLGPEASQREDKGSEGLI
ncbi:MAG: hypothetical protein QXU97_00345 [Fervidicoccaceae archaeon]